LTWYGHSAFKILTPTGKAILIDPWVSNPMNPELKGKDPKQIEDAVISSVGALDLILITHGHFDHLADAVVLAKRTKARLVTSFELGQNLARVLGFPSEQMGYDSLGNMGGTLSFFKGEVKISFTPAVHSSGLDSGKTEQSISYGGSPMGFVVEVKEGPTFYHSGDTALFSDMALIGKKFHPDVALINIGGHFGMEPDDAAAASTLIHAKLTIPHHYKTFPILTQDASEFFRLLDHKKLNHLEMKPGEKIRFRGKKLEIIK
jgi:L-ascorbate metabolism protein UlaG (beta-lactamase superfamily)